MTVCEMVLAHHPDCECPICKAHTDEECGKPAVGVCHDDFTADGAPVGGVKVCTECADGMLREHFHVTFTTN
jgi:hypothetical protein